MMNQEKNKVHQQAQDTVMRNQVHHTMTKFLRKFNGRLINKKVSFQEVIPSSKVIVDALKKQTELEYVVNINTDPMGDIIDIVSSNFGDEDTGLIDIVIDYPSKTISVFCSMEQLYLANAALWTLVNLGGEYKYKIPKWTKLPWRSVKWWHYATDKTIVICHIQIIIGWLLFPILFPVVWLIEKIGNLFFDLKQSRQ